MTEPVLWQPHPGPQSRFLGCGAFEALYGGAAGGGKSDALMVAPLRWVREPTFNALILRRTYGELEETLVARSQRVYSAVAAGAKYNAQDHVWRFPSGARVRFGYLERDDQVQQYQGAEFQFIGLDELTHFSEFQFRYLLSRLRGTAGLPKQVRAGTNPGGPGHEWVQARWGPWLGGDEWIGPRAEPGETLYYRNTTEGEEWVPKGTEGALSRVFIPAKLGDNPSLDPGYPEQLMGLDAVTRAQLMDGDWNVRPAAGLYFKDTWWKLVDAVPTGARRIRYWDLAATEEADPRTGKPKNDPDWTVGTLMAVVGEGEERKFFVEDVVRFRGSPGEVDQQMLATADLDGIEVEVWEPQDPGQAGKAQNYAHAKLLAGFTYRHEPQNGDKVTRAGPWSSCVEHGNAYLVRAKWNAAFTREHKVFPTKGEHDDQVDSASSAYNKLARPQLGFA